MSPNIMGPEDVLIGVICPLPIEVAAMLQMLDERYDSQGFPQDPNLYHLGRIGKHYVVIAGLPFGSTGIASATALAEQLSFSFKSINSLLLVGIGGGVYSRENNMRLGDVVVSRPDGRYGGVIQYDFGKSLSEGRFEYTGAMNSPPRELLSIIGAIEANHLSRGAGLSDFHVSLEQSQRNPHLKFPGTANDVIFETDYEHAGGNACSSCDTSRQIRREPRDLNGPVIHYGTIASANQLMRDATKRDSYNRDFNGRILCFEMEAAGLMNSTPCLVIRGISDYSDSHKRKDHAWHGYAAASAAAFAKEVINTLPSNGLKTSMKAAEFSKKRVLHIPFRQNTAFVGREGIIEKIQEKILEPDSDHQLALYGLGGIGKSQIMLQYAYMIANLVPERSIFWVFAGNRQRFEKDYRDIAKKLDLKQADDPKCDVLQLVKNTLEDEKFQNWLMIVDNADDMGLFFDQAQPDQGLCNFLPKNSNGSIIYTTRSKADAQRLTDEGSTMPVEVMGAQESMILLAKKLGEEIEQMDGAIDLIEELEYLPLAIVQAASYIRQMSWTVQQYLQYYREKDSDMALRLLQHEFKDKTRIDGITNAVLKTWIITFEQILHQDNRAAELLWMMSFFDRQNIPAYLLRGKGESQGAFADAIGTLKAFSFITGTRKSGNVDDIFTLHRLVQVSTRYWLGTNEGRAEQSATDALISISKVFPSGHKHENRARCGELYSHAVSVIDHQPVTIREPSAFSELIYDISWYLYRRGQYALAETYARRALAVSNLSLRETDISTLKYTHALASILLIQGKYIEAEHIARQTLELYLKVLGPEHPDTLTSMSSLGSSLSGQGRHVEAEHMYRQILELRLKVLGPEHPDTLTSMGNIGLSLSGQGRHGEAEHMHRQTLELRQKVLGPEHPDTLTSMCDLGLSLSEQGRHVEAEHMLRQTLELRQKVLGPEHPDTLTSMGDLGSSLSGQGRHVEAEHMLQQTLELCQKVLGPEHPDTLTSMCDLGLSLSGQGRHVEAEHMHRQALELNLKVLGPEHPDTLTSMGDLGSSLSGQGRHIEAEHMHRQALELRLKMLGTEHPQSLLSTWNIAYSIRCQGRYSESAILYESVCKYYQKILGLEHPRTRSCSKQYADLLEEMNENGHEWQG